MNSTIDKIELLNSIKKIEFYKKECELNYEQLKIMFENLNYSYKTNNSVKFNSCFNDLDTKSYFFIKNNDNNINILKNTIEKYSSIQEKVETIFDDII